MYMSIGFTPSYLLQIQMVLLSLAALLFAVTEQNPQTQAGRHSSLCPSFESPELGQLSLGKSRCPFSEPTSLHSNYFLKNRDSDKHHLNVISFSPMTFSWRLNFPRCLVFAQSQSWSWQGLTGAHCSDPRSSFQCHTESHCASEIINNDNFSYLIYLS